jgi:hypothetical protein
LDPAPVQSREVLLDAGRLPDLVEFNLGYFDLEDIGRFGELFPNIEVQGTWMADRVLMRSGSRLGILLLAELEDLSLPVLIDCLIKFTVIVIITAWPPEFIGTDQIRWRYITSQRQVTAVILPFLGAYMEELDDDNAREHNEE